MSAVIKATRGSRFWFRAARGLLALTVLAAGGFTVWYRSAYHVWPGQGPTALLHWCGRDYQAGFPASQTWQQIKSQQPFPIRPVGEYPPLGLWRRVLLAPTLPARQLHASPSQVCAMVIYLRSGPDQYQPYGLSGGP